MQQKECPGCAVEVTADADVCPICDYEFPQQSLANKIVVWIMILLIIFWLVL